MLTLRFESDRRGSQGDDIVFMTEAKSFRTRVHRDGGVDVLLEGESGVEVSHGIYGTLGSYDRCFVMNADGQTIAKFKALEPGCSYPVPE